MTHLLIVLVWLSMFFQLSMCNLTGDNVKCTDRLKIQVRNFHDKELVQLIENSTNSYEISDIANGLVISCTSKLPTAFHFEGNSGSQFLTAGSRGNNNCYTAEVIVNVTTGTYVCSTITSIGIARTDLLFNSSTSGYLNLEVIKYNMNHHHHNSLVLNCPTRNPNSTLTPCQQMYSYIFHSFDSQGESIKYVMRRHELVNDFMILNNSIHENVQTNPSCISSEFTPVRQWDCEDYEECPCSEFKILLMGQQICTRDILLKCPKRFGCEFTPWNQENYKSPNFFECQNAIHFADTYSGNKYIGQIIDATCKASKLIFSQHLKLFIVFQNGSTIEMDQSATVSSNDFYTLTSQFQVYKEIKGLKCSAPYLHLTGWQSQQTNTNAFSKSKVFDPIPPQFKNHSKLYVRRDGKDKVTCEVRAAPTPTIRLMYANGTLLPNIADYNTTDHHIHVAKFTNVYIGRNVLTLVCKAWYPDIRGLSEANHSIALCSTKGCDIPKNIQFQEQEKTLVAAGTSIGIIGVLICIVGGLWMKWTIHKRTQNFKFQVSPQVIKEFLNGNPNSDMYIEKTPYCLEDEVLESLIKIEILLGSGNFGDVKKGTLTKINEKGEEEYITVAIKSAPIKVPVRDLGSEVERKKAEKDFMPFLKEIKFNQEIKKDGGHENVVTYIGAMTKQIKHFDVNAILEYCEGGDLKTFLTINKSHFTNKFQDFTEIVPTTPLVGYTTLNFAGNCVVPEEDLNKFDTDDLIRWSKEIASGMSYINNLKVIHLDLAARNVLLAKVEGKFVAKISDFGLSKKLNPQSKPYYNVRGKCIVSWPWQPPELKENEVIKIRLNSDIWSYGVTLWEIFTLGNDPAENLGKESEVEKPGYANSAVYKIMLTCFDKCAERRPSFTQLRTGFTTLEEQLQKNIEAYYDIDDDYGYESFME